MNGSLLLVDDEPNVIKALQREFRAAGYTVHCATSAEEGLGILAHNPIDVIISDQRMPMMSGSEFLAKAQKQFPDTIRIMLSGYSDFQAVVSAINDGSIYKFWAKPWDSETLRQQLDEVFSQNQKLQRERQFSSVIDSSLEAVVVTYLDGTVASANPAIEMVTGYSATELIGNNFFTECVASKQEAQLENILAAIGELGSWECEVFGKRKDGSEFIQQLSISAVETNHGDITHLGMFVLDITEKKAQALRDEFFQRYGTVNDCANQVRSA